MLVLLPYVLEALFCFWKQGFPAFVFLRFLLVAREVYASEINVFIFEVKGGFDGAVGQVFDVETHLLS